jgi:hypothetical protein
MIIIFYVLLLAVFFRSFSPWRTRRATAIIVFLLIIAASINGARVFLRANEWIKQGNNYTDILKKVGEKIKNAKAPNVLIKLVDNSDNQGVFLRYSYVLNIIYKRGFREQKISNRNKALRFSETEKKRLEAGDLTIFVYNNGKLLVFKKI